MSIPVALTIAGSDSGGGAGIQADLKTFHAFGVFGTSAITAITAQNTLAVHSVHPVPPQIVREQISAVASDFRVDAVKTGMLATALLVDLVADAIRAEKLPNYVLDPVMVATSGDRLLAEDAQDAIISALLPLCTVVTPNIEEARILTGLDVRDTEGMKHAAHALVEKGAGAALVKGGHLEGAHATDVLYDGTDYTIYTHDRIKSTSTHGTGCTLSAAIAAELAHGRTLQHAVEVAVEFVHRAIATAPGLGSGHGPLNHFTALPTSEAG
jgi:hydroxymethylpyrimidine/phosphomethylpyrimidine kinase